MASNDTDWLQLLSDAERASGKSKPSLLEDIARVGMSGLGRVANVLDVPGSVVRDLATWAPGGLEPQNPVDQLLPQNWTSSDSRVGSFRDIFRSYGLASEEDTWTNFLTGVGFDIAADPLTYMTFGTSALSQGGRAAKAAGIADDLTKVAAKKKGVQIGAVGAREARSMLKVSDLVEAGGKSAEGKLRRYARANKLKYDDLVDQNVGGAFGLGAPFTQPKSFVGQGPTGRKIAQFLDQYSVNPFDAGRKVKDWKIPGTGVRPVGDLEVMLNARIARARTALTRTQGDSLFRRKLENHADTLEFIGSFANVLRRNDWIGDDAAKKLRGALEVQIDQIPDNVPPDIVDMIRRADEELGPMVDQANNLGLSLDELTDAMVEIAEGKYAPRYLNVDIDKYGGTRFGNAAIYSTSDRSALGRKQPLKGIRGMTNTLNEMAADDAVNELIASGAGAEDVAAMLREKYPDVMQNSEFPSFEQVEEYQKALAAGEEDLIDPGVDQYQAFAEWLPGVPEEIRKAGVFGNHPLFDLAQRINSHKDRVAAAEMMYETLSQPGVVTESAEGGMRVGKFFEEARLTSSRAKQVLRDRMKAAGLDAGPMQASSSGVTPLHNRYINQTVAEDLLKHFEAITAPDPAGPIMQAWDSVRNLWKGSLTGAWPAFHVRNRMSGMIDNMLAGTFSVQSERLANRLFLGEVVPEAMDIEAVRELARKQGYEVDDVVFPADGLRDRFKQYMDDALFGDPAVEHSISRDQMNDIVSLAEARAAVWSKETGRPADEWFAQIGGVVSMDFRDFLRGFNSKDPDMLMQAHPYDIPLVEGWNKHLYGETADGTAFQVWLADDGQSWRATISNPDLGLDERDVGLFSTREEARAAMIERYAEMSHSGIEETGMFYSKALKSTLEKVSGPVDYQQYQRTMAKSGVSAEELSDLMMEEFFAGGKKTPQQIAKYINEASPRFEFTAAREGEDFVENVIKSPRGDDYGTLLLRLPGASVDRPFYGPHFDDDIVAHARFDTVHTADGKKALRIQEIQSDWHQQGRVEGYAPRGRDINTDNAPQDIIRHIDSALAEGADSIPLMSSLTETEVRVVGRDGMYAILEDGRQINVERLSRRPPSNIPDAPFKKSWPMLMVKRLLRKAADEGFDEVIIPDGAFIARAVGGPERALGKWYNEVLTNQVKKYTKKWKSYQGTRGGAVKDLVDTKFPQYADISAADTRELNVLVNDAARFRVQRPQVVGGGIPEAELDRFHRDVIDEVRKDLVHRLDAAQDQLDRYEALRGSPEFDETQWRRRSETLDRSVETLHQFDNASEGGLETVVQQIADLNGPHSSQVFKVTDEMRQAVQGKQPLYQQFMGNPKGAAVFHNDMRSTLFAFQAADVSTLAHELGHVFRRDLPPSLQKKAVDAISEFVEKPTMSDGAWTREAEEEFARGFERYLRDGKAPTKELRSLFGKFRDWLVRIYKHLTGSAIERNVSPELAEVFDKMLGSTAPSRGPLTPEVATDLLGELHYANGIGGKFEGVAEEVIGETQSAGRGSLDDILRQMPRTEFRQRDIPNTLKRAAGMTDETTLNPFRAQFRGVGGAEESTFGPMAAGQDIGHYVEFMNRSAPFIRQLQEGASATFAAAKVGATQVMYQNKYFTTEERQILQRLFPFYKFSRGKLPWTFQQIMENPAGPLGRILRVIGDLQGQAEFTPDYVAETASIPLTGALGPEDESVDRYLTGFGASFEDPLSFLQGPRGLGLEVLSRADPVLKGSLEWFTGESFFQKGPMGGRDLIDQDPTIGRTLSNVKDWWTGGKSYRPVELPDWLEHAAMNSPLSRLLTSARVATDQRKDSLTKLAVLGTGVRVADISEAAQDAVIDERLGNLQRMMGAKSFARTYFREEDKAEMSPEQLEIAERMEELSDLLADRAKRRKAARSAERGDAEKPKAKRKKKPSYREARGLR